MLTGIARGARARGLARGQLVEKLESLAVSADRRRRATRPRTPGSRVTAVRAERAKKIDWTNLRRALGHCGSPGERIFIAYEYFAEPFLAEDYRSADGSHSLPVFIVDYPDRRSAPLARRKDADPTLVDRFELFVHGRELCNAFSELNDPDDQAEPLPRTRSSRRARGAEETMDYDDDYIRRARARHAPGRGLRDGRRSARR